MYSRSPEDTSVSTFVSVTLIGPTWAGFDAGFEGGGATGTAFGAGIGGGVTTIKGCPSVDSTFAPRGAVERSSV